MEREPGTVIRVIIDHIGHDGIAPLPATKRYKWAGGVTEIVHVAAVPR